MWLGMVVDVVWWPASHGVEKLFSAKNKKCQSLVLARTEEMVCQCYRAAIERSWGVVGGV